MFPETSLPFLKEKILDLRSALFFSLSNAVLKIPTTIVTALKVDDVGQLWFFVNRPTQYIQEFDREFPARLDFFRKGKNFNLKIMGKACIVNDPEELSGLVNVSEEIKTNAMSHLVLVKVKIHSAEYMEHSHVEGDGWLKRIRSLISKWFRNQSAGYRPYSLQPAH